jgi:glycosyltransferase involved in cell wall biosynthesis
MKVLLFSNDLMPFGELPTSGGGLRCWQLMQGLQSQGIEVHASMPGFTYLAEKYREQIPEEQASLLWQWETQNEIYRRVKPDAVLFASNWDHYGLTIDIDVPLIIDLHGSRLIETSMWNEPVDTDRKVQVLSKADCLLCAGVRQRSYFYGWLVQAGRVPEDEHFIRYIPVSLSPETPVHHYPEAGADGEPRIVSGGGWFPWQNQSQTIFAICEAIKKRDQGSISIFGTPHETQTLSAEEQIIRDIYARVQKLADSSSRIDCHGYIGRKDLLEIYSRASVAVEAMTYNLERELAFTTRTIEYLWCGIPVLYNDFGEISGHIRDYDAGWAINPESEEEIRGAIEEIFDDPAKVAQKGRNAAKLVRDRFSWDKTISPLVDFLNKPVRASQVNPVHGSICARPSYLSPSGQQLDMNISADGTEVTQDFVVPAENISTVELPISLESAAIRDAIEHLEIRLKNESGRVLAKRKLLGSQIPVQGKITIDFPTLFRPKGGTPCSFSLRCQAKGSQAISVRGLADSGFPFRGRLKAANSSAAILGKTMLGEEVPAKALALNFVPGTGRVYQVKMLLTRAYWMLRKGQWRRLSRAFVRRVPGAITRLKYAVTG